LNYARGATFILNVFFFCCPFVIVL